MAYELTGKVKVILDQQTFGSGFTKRELVVTVEDGKYPQDICIEFVQDKISLLESVQEGDDVTVTFDIRGREYKGRYYNNLQGWRIESAETGAPGNADEGLAVDARSGPGAAFIEDDDIPF